MDISVIVLIILSSLLVVIIATGLLLKRFTKRRLGEIDGFQGIMRKKDCKGVSLGVMEGSKDALEKDGSSQEN